MAFYSEVFERKEMKYCLTAKQRTLLEAEIAKYLIPGEFAQTRISSLYYDTPDFALIERSLDKPLYKEKLRLRIYGAPSALAPSFVEVKKKFKGIVYKRRVLLSLRAAKALLDGMPYEQACRAFPLLDQEAHARSLSDLSCQIGHEIEYLLQRYGGLEPSLLIICERNAYADPEGSELRITFDSDLACAYSAQDVFAAASATPLIDPSISIMEVKNAGPLPFWLIHALNAVQARPQSFSKYGHAYLNHPMIQRKDDKSA